MAPTPMIIGHYKWDLRITVGNATSRMLKELSTPLIDMALSVWQHNLMGGDGVSTDLHSGVREDMYGVMADEDVVEMAQDGSNSAVEYLLTKYQSFVIARASSYFVVGGSREDIIQEGMIGLYKAIRDFRGERLAFFRPFADMCIRRQIITAIKTATRQKHIHFNYAVSLDRPIYKAEDSTTLLDVCSAGKASNPEDIVVSQEKIEDIEATIAEVLSDLEREVLVAFLDGKSYRQIASKLGIKQKSVDNALQRVKKKLHVYFHMS